MCHPAAFAVMGGLQAGVQALGARQQAKAQYQAARQQAEMQRRYQEQAAAAERQRAQQEQSSMRMRQAQEQEAVGRELEQVSRKSQAALARARVAAGESGAIVGQSAQQLLDDYVSQEGRYRAALLRQQELGAVGTGLGLEQAGLASQQRLIGIRQPIAQPIRPRGLGIQDVLGVASGAMQGYMGGRMLSNGVSGSSDGLQRFDSTVSADAATTMPSFFRPLTISLGGGKTSTYMPETDQYSI